MADLKTIATDVVAREEGVWETYHTHPDGDIKCLIASSDNDAFRKAYRHSNRKKRKGFRDGHEDDQAIEARDVRLVARHILKDWKNVKIDGVDTPYTPEIGVQVLGDPQYRHFYDWIWGLASDIANFTAADREERAGNSESASTGSSSTARPDSTTS